MSTPAEDSNYTLENALLTLVLDRGSRGGLAALVDRASGRNLIGPALHPLFRLVLSRKDSPPLELTALDAAEWTAHRSSDQDQGALDLTYSNFRDLALRVACRVTLAQDSAQALWSIQVENETDYGIRSLFYPIVVAPPMLGESEDDDRYVDGIFGGRIVERPGKKVLRPSGVRPATLDSWLPMNQYPGVVCAQFQAYFDSTAGLYQAAYDASGAIKDFGLYNLDGNLDLTIVHHYDERPGLSFELPYPVALGVFHGDWHTAADLYKEWARGQHWCSRTLVERDDVPAWLRESRPCMMVISQGNVERARGTLNFPPAEFPLGKVWPARKAVALVREFSRRFETPVIVWMEGWEKIGAPGGPAEIFPPLEGEESYKSAMAEFEASDVPVLMYLAGFHWTYKRPMTGYHDWEAFMRDGRHMAVEDPNGNLLISDNAARTYLDGQKHFVSLCVGSQDTQDLFVKNFLKMMDLGAVAVQNDQQLGFYADACYSENHDHHAGYGPWMYNKTLEFIRRSRQEIKRRNPAGSLDVEAPCEIWIQEIDFFIDRPYSVHSLPVFQYLYHEFTASYGGDDMLNVCHLETSQMMQAKILTLGIRNIVVVNQPDYDFEVNPNYPVLTLMRNISRAQRTFVKDYVVFGEMIRPAQLEVEEMMVDIYRSPVMVPMRKVFHSTWAAPDGRTGTILANWTTATQNVLLALDPNGQPPCLVDDGSMRAIAPEATANGQLAIQIDPLSVVLVEQRP
jgi:hypothetical protein